MPVRSVRGPYYYKNSSLVTCFGFLGLFISIILLRNIKSDSISLENEEEEKEEQDDIKTLSAIGIVLLLLSAIFLTGIGIYEIWFRLQ